MRVTDAPSRKILWPNEPKSLFGDPGKELQMKVIVPLDGSAFAEAVLPTVALLAHKGGIDVKLVSVLKPSSPAQETTGTSAENPEQALDVDSLVHEDYLTRVFKDHFLGRAGATVIEGRHVAEELIRHFRDEEADFITMATHGRTGLARLVMGSVAQDIMNTGDVPVMLVRPKGLN
jgi:nucleotide-binding universal stress UspA family protein